ncbi:protein kinase family protein [Streptomyces omiyaensis]|uniref:Protein kinase family protein n=1 Tax=Streptomyces omiyaensis TaxID=68247 RepID=A0ABW7BYD8_9ACTN|nr:protein kinase family protein [Streptomyces omiyaensis]GGY67018.1 serine/threonine protein kinase [Streptomyces omiyaensis]
MAERSTAAVDVADNSGDNPLTAQADTAATDGVAEERKTAEEPTGAPEQKAVEQKNGEQPSITAPELHSGHKLARRYRLEECVTRLDGFSSWRAVDEKLRRAVGVHLLPADHPRARSVLAAARSAALLGDPRFVQVLDAVEENDLVYVVHEWLPDTTELTALLADGPLQAHDAYQLVSQVSQAMAAAHREGLAHLRLTPSAVLRSSTGQYRIRGLAVNAALRGITSDGPQRTDTEAIGALLYAALTQRWPYESDAYGLSGLPKGVGLIPPDQVRAGVHRGLAEIAMRALANDGATASRQEPPCTTPDELAKAVAAMPRVKPPEPEFVAPVEYQHQRTTYQQGTYGRPQPRPMATQPMPVPPAPLESRTGKALKWAVGALLIAALGLGSWQIADRLLPRDNQTTNNPTPAPPAEEKPEPPKPLAITSADDFDPPPGGNGEEYPESVGMAHDGDPSTFWHTKNYKNAKFGNLKDGVGIVLDLGSDKKVSEVDLSFVGHTSVEIRTAPEGASTAPSTAEGFTTQASQAGTDVKLPLTKPVTTRYVLVWLTELPLTDGEFRGQLSEVKIMG